VVTQKGREVPTMSDLKAPTYKHETVVE
jgi:hypothetical protein